MSIYSSSYFIAFDSSMQLLPCTYTLLPLFIRNTIVMLFLAECNSKDLRKLCNIVKFYYVMLIIFVVIQSSCQYLFFIVPSLREPKFRKQRNIEGQFKTNKNSAWLRQFLNFIYSTNVKICSVR